MASSATLAPVSERAPTPRPEAVPRPRPLAIIVAMLALVVATGALIVPRLLNPRATYDPSSASTAAFEDATGLRLLRVASTGAVGLVEVQYQIVDRTQAASILGHKTFPVIIDDASGRVLATPYMGHAPMPTLRQGSDFFVLLQDAGHSIGAGGSVTVILGDERLEHVPVE